MSVVHVAKGGFSGQKRLDGVCVEEITAYLFNTGGHDDPMRLVGNASQSFQGSIVLGPGFTFDDTGTKGLATPLAEMRQLVRENPRNADVIFPYIGGREVNTSPTHAHHRYVINFRDYPLRREDLGELWCDADEKKQEAWFRSGIVPLDYAGPVAADWPELLAIVTDRVKPSRDRVKRKARRERWWQFGDRQPGLYIAIAERDVVLVTSAAASKFHVFARIPSSQVFSHKLIAFPLSSYAAFGSLQARPHESWSAAFGSTLEDRPTYNPTDVFETYPFPRNWTTDSTLEAVGQAYYEFRADLMVTNNEGLTKTYNRFHDPDEANSPIAELRSLHAAMDRAVLDAYGWTDIPTDCEFLQEHDDDEGSPRRKRRYRYRWPDAVRDEVLSRLLELNAERAEEERRMASKEATKR